MYGRTGDKNPKSIKVYAVGRKHTFVFASIREAAQHIGISAGYMGALASHKRQSNVYKEYCWFTEKNYPINNT
jgi:hypothetical protein